jgi:hypothetical protein
VAEPAWSGPLVLDRLDHCDCFSGPFKADFGGFQPRANCYPRRVGADLASATDEFGADLASATDEFGADLDQPPWWLGRGGKGLTALALVSNGLDQRHSDD